MKFSPAKVAFGRHESFALRFGWLTKGFQNFESCYLVGQDLFTMDDSVVRLGVGKNMVNSIRHWLKAARLIETSNNKNVPTKLGRYLFSENNGKDQYLEDESTIWLLHWLITTNPEMATSWYWFFNKYHKSDFTGTEATTALLDYLQENVTARYSSGTVKKDLSVLLRCYTQSSSSVKSNLEDALDSPLSLLRLVKYIPTLKRYESKLEARSSLPLGIVGYAVTALFMQKKITELPLSDLMYGDSEYPGLGTVFRITESDLIAKLELLVEYLPGFYEIDETAGVHQLYMLDEVDPYSYLDKQYTS